MIPVAGVAENPNFRIAAWGTLILADRESHRRLEWDIRNGAIIRKARAHSLATPISDVVVPLLAAVSGVPG